MLSDARFVPKADVRLAVDCERDSLVGDRAGQGDFCVLRVILLVIAISMLFGASAALAAEPMAPNDIKANFFTGQPFTAASPSGAKFKMTFTPDGKMTREPLELSGNASAGTWKGDASVRQKLEFYSTQRQRI